MQKSNIKKLSLHKEVLRSLAGRELADVRGGAVNEPTHGCTTVCTGGGGTGPATGGNDCILTEFTCVAC